MRNFSAFWLRHCSCSSQIRNSLYFLFDLFTYTIFQEGDTFGMKAILQEFAIQIKHLFRNFLHHSIPDLAGWNKETEEKNTLPSESNLLLGTKQNKEATRLIINPNKSLIKERQSPDLMSYMS